MNSQGEEVAETTPKMTPPAMWVGSFVFSDGTTIQLKRNDVVVIVGPNNAGKSASLRAIRDKVYSNKASSIVPEITLAYRGTADDVLSWIESYAHKPNPFADNPILQVFGAGVHRSQVAAWWGGESLQGLARFFCHLLTTDDRLRAANPVETIAMLHDSPEYPLHYLYQDESLETLLSGKFRKAFGSDLVLNRLAGSQLVLHVGARPEPDVGADRLSQSYARKLEKLDQLQFQGDGMRSFAGVLLHTAIGRESLVLVDEPEAFLHPPQARHIGRMLIEDGYDDRQVFVATHSGDVLRGVLDGGGSRVRVVRVQRDRQRTIASQLDNSSLTDLWKDPLLRHSNILDGVFHERVVVCESDSDARFYAAVANTMLPSGEDASMENAVMFTHCGGKERIHTVVAALSHLGVPVVVAVDFDVLSCMQPLMRIFEASGGSWADISSDWGVVSAAVNGMRTESTSDEIKTRIVSILDGVGGARFPESAREAIRKELRKGSPWSIAKKTGRHYIPSGGPTLALDRLLGKLREYGIHVVEIGELESFDRTVSHHGPRWVNAVLNRDLASDTQLAEARRYVAELLRGSRCQHRINGDGGS